MKNVFEHHGVEYLSPSSINKFRDDPAKWLVNIAGYRDRAYSPAMTFGNIVELGITHACMRPDSDIEEAIQLCMDRYALTHKEIMDDKVDYDFDKCFEKQMLLPNTLKKVIPLYRQIEGFEEAQVKVEYKFPEMPIPIRGYVDMMYESQVRDIKTTGRQPKNNGNYNRQLGFYCLATKKKPILDYIYVTKYKQEFITVEVQDIQSHIDDLKRIALKMMRILSFSSDINEVAHMSCLEPDTSNENFMRQWGPQEIKGAHVLFKE